MRGHLRKRGQDTWALVVDLGRDPQTDKRRQQWHTVKGTKKDAERELRDLLHRIETGGYVQPAHLTMGAFLEQWLADYAATNTGPRTVENYRGYIRRYLLPHLGSVPLEKLTPQQVQGIYAQMLGRGLSARTVLHAHRVLSEALAHAVKWGLVARNVANAVDPPKPQRKEMSTLDSEGVARFVRAAQKSPYLALFTLAIYTGLRRSELVGLRWQDVDLAGGALSVTQTLQRVHGQGLLMLQPKTARSRRRVALSPEVVALLRAHRARQAELRLAVGPVWQEGGWVFTRPDGRPLDPDEVTHAFARTIKAAGIAGVRLHDLRHTHASLMLAQGVHPKIVSERLGHASITITLDTYSHVLPGLQEAAALAFEVGLKPADVAAAGAH